MLKIISAIFAMFALCAFGLTAVSLGAAVYNFPKYKDEIREKIKERPKILVESSIDVSNNLKSIWAAHTANQDMTMFFMTRGGFTLVLFMLALFLWNAALQIQLFALSAKEKSPRGTATHS